MSILATVFGGLALVLACIGLYGVMANRVAGRTREIAVRIAVGARSASVIWMVIRNTVALVLFGAALGGMAAALAGRYVRSQLFDVAPGDLVSTSAAIALLAVVAIAAGYLPARRATRIDPAVALRMD
jgi:ABC-type antimicrobial peptide transport system permease subunit